MHGCVDGRANGRRRHGMKGPASGRQGQVEYRITSAASIFALTPFESIAYRIPQIVFSFVINSPGKPDRLMSGVRPIVSGAP